MTRIFKYLASIFDLIKLGALTHQKFCQIEKMILVKTNVGILKSE